MSEANKLAWSAIALLRIANDPEVDKDPLFLECKRFLTILKRPLYFYLSKPTPQDVWNARQSVKQRMQGEERKLLIWIYEI